MSFYSSLPPNVVPLYGPRPNPYAPRPPYNRTMPYGQRPMMMPPGMAPGRPPMMMPQLPPPGMGMPGMIPPPQLPPMALANLPPLAPPPEPPVLEERPAAPPAPTFPPPAPAAPSPQGMSTAAKVALGGGALAGAALAGWYFLKKKDETPAEGAAQAADADTTDKPTDSDDTTGKTGETKASDGDKSGEGAGTADGEPKTVKSEETSPPPSGNAEGESLKGDGTAQPQEGENPAETGEASQTKETKPESQRSLFSSAMNTMGGVVGTGFDKVKGAATNTVAFPVRHPALATVGTVAATLGGAYYTGHLGTALTQGRQMLPNMEWVSLEGARNLASNGWGILSSTWSKGLNFFSKAPKTPQPLEQCFNEELGDGKCRVPSLLDHLFNRTTSSGEPLLKKAKTPPPPPVKNVETPPPPPSVKKVEAPPPPPTPVKQEVKTANLTQEMVDRLTPFIKNGTCPANPELAKGYKAFLENPEYKQLRETIRKNPIPFPVKPNNGTTVR